MQYISYFHDIVYANYYTMSCINYVLCFSAVKKLCLIHTCNNGTLQLCIYYKVQGCMPRELRQERMGREGKQEKELGGGGVSGKEGERVNDEQSSS